MSYAAFEAREVTGSALLKDRQLLELWKWAAKEGLIDAITSGGRNYVVVKDDDLVERIRAAAPALIEYRYDAANRKVAKA